MDHGVNMKIVYLMMVHEHIDLSADLICLLLKDPEATVVLHVDAKYNTPLPESLDHAKNYLNERVFLAERTHVEWGEWGMIEASLNCFKTLKEYQITYDYAMLVSGACYPIKPYEEFKSFLESSSNTSFIEHVDATKERWIFDGIQQERWEHLHYINWRKNPKLFSQSIQLQSKLHLKRKLPDGFTPYMGSQWWTLTKETVDQTYKYSQKQKVRSFYKRTWIPDELYFQTVVANLFSEDRLETFNLTYYHFELRGAPKVLYESHLTELIHSHNKFFARKLSPCAAKLREELSKVYCMSSQEFKVYKEEHQEVPKDIDLFKNRVLDPVARPGDKIKSLKNKFLVVISDLDWQLKEVQSALNDLPNVCMHGLLAKESPNEAYHSSFIGFKKQLIIHDEFFTTDDLIDILAQTPKNMIGGLLLNFPDPLTPKLLGDIIEAENAVILHILSTDANYLDGNAYNREVALVNQLATDKVVPLSDIDNLKSQLFKKHFTYDYGFMQWIGSKDAEYHQIWFSNQKGFKSNLQQFAELIL